MKLEEFVFNDVVDCLQKVIYMYNINAITNVMYRKSLVPLPLFNCKLPSDSAIFSVKAWVLELPGVYLLIGVDWVGFQSLYSNIYGNM